MPATPIELRERNARAAAALLGGEVAHAEPLGGGCLEEVTRVKLRDGRRAVAKGGPAPRVEAAMLEAMRAAGVPAPRVLAVEDRLLVMEERPRRGALADAWGDLGRVLATLHAAEGERYGWDVDYAYGPIALPNAPTDDWPAFWAERRLLAHADALPADLAMLTLFDRPDARFYDAYPVAADWRERQPIYQLWPAIVHLLLFGDGYRGLVERLLRVAGG